MSSVLIAAKSSLHSRHIGLNGSQERMQVNLMHRRVVDIRAARRPVSFLFIENVVLGASLDASVLNTLYAVVSGFSSEVRVSASHFPLSAFKSAPLAIECERREKKLT